MSNVQFIYDAYTEDGFKIQMLHFDPKERDICVVFNHGMTASIIGCFFAPQMGDRLNDAGVGFLQLNNRGHDPVNDLYDRNGNVTRMGTAYEIFEECVYDIDLGIKQARELGYKRIILAGHSLGCCKTIYHYYKKHPDIIGIFMVSMPDMLGLQEMLTTPEEREQLLSTAQKYVAGDNGRALLNHKLFGWAPVSARTYLNWFGPDTNLNNIPVIANPEKWEQLSEIDVPIFTTSGGNEDDPYLHHDLIKEKALKCPDFESCYIPDTDHDYTGKEDELAIAVTDWVVRKFK